MTKLLMADPTVIRQPCSPNPTKSTQVKAAKVFDGAFMKLIVLFVLTVFMALTVFMVLSVLILLEVLVVIALISLMTLIGDVDLR